MANKATAKSFCKAGPDKNLLIQMPMIMPKAPPKEKPASTIGSMLRPTHMFETTPTTLMQEITSNEVPIAKRMGMRQISTKAGTIMNPPPTPNNPESKPVTTPVTSNKMISILLRGIVCDVVAACLDACDVV